MSSIKLAIYTILILFSQRGICQFIGPYEINVAGKETKNNNYVLSYTIGGNVATTDNTKDFSFKQGVQQPTNISIYSVKTYQNITFKAIVYPNPTSDLINISLRNIDKPITCLVYYTDMRGTRQIIDNNKYEFINNQSATISVNTLPSGMYFISLVSEKNKLQIASFKLIKKQ